MRLDQEDTSAFNTHLKSVRFSFAHKALTTDAWLTLHGPIINAYDPLGGSWNIWLPENEPGRFFVVGNIGTSGTITIKTAGGTVLNSLAVGETVTLFSGDNEWTGTNSPLDLAVFGYTGAGHKEGLVPDPGAGPVSPDPAFRRYLSELGWATVAPPVTPGVNFFYSMKGGAVTLTPVGTEAVEFTSANTAISILANSGTTPKSVAFTLNAANINHNSLQNYVADQHVAHSSVTLTAGVGLSGGGTIAANRTFAFDPSELNAVAPLTSHYMVVEIPTVGPGRVLLSGLSAILDHNALLNYVADQHVAHSTVSITASTGLSGGGSIASSRSIALAIDSLVAAPPAVGDFIPYFDISEGDHNKMSVTTLNGVLDHNALLNYVAAEHFLDAAPNGNLYARQNNAWAAIPRITVGTTAPSSPAVNDVWIDTN